MKTSCCATFRRVPS